jgi:demethylspheroidene O-methyltransferase
VEPGGARGGFGDRWRALRDQLLASPRFRRWAAAFPPTRPIARRRARALFDLCSGFVYSQVLRACVELRVFDALAQGPQTATMLAPRLGLAPSAAERLLAAAAALGLASRRSGERYGLGPLGAALVDNPAVTAMVMHHALLYRDLADPVGLLRGTPSTQLAGYWPYAAGGGAGGFTDADVADYTRLMAASQPLVAEEALAAYSLRGHRCLLDVGGGDGSFVLAASAVAPALRLMLFDLPPVAARAGVHFDAAGLGARATAHGGDFRADPLPTGADIATLVRVLHDHDDADAAAILANVYRALPPGGTLLVVEPMAGAAGVETVGDAYFGFYLLAMGRGRARTPQALGALLDAAGFRRWHTLRTRIPLQTGLIVAIR